MENDDQILSDSMMAGSGIVPAERPEPKPDRKPSYRVRSVDPKMGNIDDQFALIETDRGFGAPASDPGMRRIVVGDSLPEGEVTAITGEGIQVIPDEGDEYVIPLGSREGYKPPVSEKKQPDTLYDNEGLRGVSSMLEETARNPRSRFMDSLTEDAAAQVKFYETDDPKKASDLVQEDFQRSFRDDRVLEMTEIPEGMLFLFQDDDGNISSYFQDHDGQAIRTTPEEGTKAYYTIPDESVPTALDEILSFGAPFNEIMLQGSEPDVRITED